MNFWPTELIMQLEKGGQIILINFFFPSKALISNEIVMDN